MELIGESEFSQAKNNIYMFGGKKQLERQQWRNFSPPASNEKTTNRKIGGETFPVSFQGRTCMKNNWRENFYLAQN